jgi:hypothetical protein
LGSCYTEETYHLWLHVPPTLLEIFILFSSSFICPSSWMNQGISYGDGHLRFYSQFSPSIKYASTSTVSRPEFQRIWHFRIPLNIFLWLLLHNQLGTTERVDQQFKDASSTNKAYSRLPTTYSPNTSTRQGCTT